MIKLLNLLSVNKFIGFLFVGSFNTLMAFAIYALLLGDGVHYMLASSASFVFGVLEGYTLNSFLVFRVKPQFKSLFKFTSVYIISLVLNLTMMYLLVEQLHMDKLIAQIITSLVLAVVNFYLIKIFVYRLQPGIS
jgi:putative flippase GtrA